jgi:hypothetical protein
MQLLTLIFGCPKGHMMSLHWSLTFWEVLDKPQHVTIDLFEATTTIGQALALKALISI